MPRGFGVEWANPYGRTPPGAPTHPTRGSRPQPLEEIPVTERKLDVPAGYDPAAQPRIASFAAQLDDQLRRLKKDVAEFEVKHLEWQPRPGVNTVGMLLAHLAVVDLWWLVLVPNGTPQAKCNDVMEKTIGIGMDDDGLPLAADGAHAAPLVGRSLSNYMTMLDAAREAAHAVLRTWRDDQLASTVPLGDRTFSREWIVYHVLEHFAGHYGQILLLRHLMRDAGLLPRPADR